MKKTLGFIVLFITILVGIIYLKGKPINHLQKENSLEIENVTKINSSGKDLSTGNIVTKVDSGDSVSILANKIINIKDKADCDSLEDKYKISCKIIYDNKKLFSGSNINTGIKDNMLYIIASNSQDISFCDLVYDDKIKQSCKSDIKKNSVLLKYLSECVQKKDIKICNGISNTAYKNMFEDCKQKCQSAIDFSDIITKIKTTKDKNLCNQIKDEAYKKTCKNDVDDMVLEYDIINSLYKTKDPKVCDGFKTQGYKNNCLKIYESIK